MSLNQQVNNSPTKNYSMSFRIVELEHADFALRGLELLDCIKKLCEDAKSCGNPVYVFRRMSALNPNSSTFVALDKDDRIVGFAYVQLSGIENQGPFCDIVYVWIKPGARDVFEAGWEVLENWAKSRKCVGFIIEMTFSKRRYIFFEKRLKKRGFRPHRLIFRKDF